MEVWQGNQVDCSEKRDAEQTDCRLGLDPKAEVEASNLVGGPNLAEPTLWERCWWLKEEDQAGAEVPCYESC